LRVADIAVVIAALREAVKDMSLIEYLRAPIRKKSDAGGFDASTVQISGACTPRSLLTVASPSELSAKALP
jgi:hypothetical protein